MTCIEEAFLVYRGCNRGKAGKILWGLQEMKMICATDEEHDIAECIIKNMPKEVLKNKVGHWKHRQGALSDISGQIRGSSEK